MEGREGKGQGEGKGRGGKEEGGGRKGKGRSLRHCRWGIDAPVFVYLHRLIYTMCLKCPPVAYRPMHVFSREYHWSTDASIVHCSILCQTFIFMTERNE